MSDLIIRESAPGRWVVGRPTVRDGTIHVTGRTRWPASPSDAVRIVEDLIAAAQESPQAPEAREAKRATGSAPNPFDYRPCLLKPQAKRAIKLMVNLGGLTTLEAMEYGIGRLSARVGEIRRVYGDDAVPKDVGEDIRRKTVCAVLLARTRLTRNRRRSMIGKWIDSLNDEQRDRIVEAMEWKLGEVGLPGGPRCLVGHAYAVVPDDETGVFWTIYKGQLGWPHTSPVELRFDALCNRFGLGRIVRACKLRAGANLPTGPGTDRGTQTDGRASEAGGLPGVVVAVGDANG